MKRGLTSPASPQKAGDSADQAPVVETMVRALPARRRPWLIAAGVLMTVVGALGAVWLVGQAGQRAEVLVVRRDVPYGESLRADDFSVTRVSTDPGVLVVPSSEVDSVIGRVAATDLVAGMILTPHHVAVEAGPTAGMALVPISLPGDRIPATGIRTGDQVMVVNEEALASAPVRGSVTRVSTPDVNGLTVVDVLTPQASAASLATASIGGRVAIVILPVRG